MAFAEQRHLEELLKKSFGEEYVYKGDFKYEDSGRDMVLLLGTEHFFEIDGNEKKKKKRRDGGVVMHEGY